MINPSERNPLKFQVARLLRHQRMQHGGDLTADVEREEFMAAIEQATRDIQQSKNLSSGMQAENIFKFLAISLNFVDFLKEEDAGQVFTRQPSTTIPDFRLRLASGEEVLVEVKSFYQKKGPIQSYKISQKALQRLMNYSRACGLSLRFAIYWRRWNMWTLIDPRRFERRADRSKFVCTFDSAVLHNEMAALGDGHVLAPSPASIRYHPAHPTQVSETSDQKLSFSVGKTSYHLGKSEFKTTAARNAVQALLLYGLWPLSQPVAVNTGTQLDYVEYATHPEYMSGNEVKGQTHMIGSLSSIGSSYCAISMENSISEVESAREFSKVVVDYLRSGKSHEDKLGVFLVPQMPVKFRDQDQMYLDFRPAWPSQFGNIEHDSSDK